MFYYGCINLGGYTQDARPDDHDMLITEKCCFSDLVSGLNSSCSCGLTLRPWSVESIQQVCLVVTGPPEPVQLVRQKPDHFFFAIRHGNGRYFWFWSSVHKAIIIGVEQCSLSMCRVAVIHPRGG